jgi:dTDP-4-dehydrorhamnose 3,5-epimerase
MKLIKTELKDVFIIENFEQYDECGGYVEIFNDEFFRKSGIDFRVKEIYYSLSHKNVIRGMHFQLPPYDHAKFVYVTTGKIIDVVLDLRKEEPTYGKYITVKLSPNKKAVFIPSGLAHGFKSLQHKTTVISNVSQCTSKEHASGILWNSFGFNWDITEPVISEKDKNFISFDNFKSEF